MTDQHGELTRYSDTPRPDLLDPVTDSWVATVAEVARLAAYIADTPFVPQGLRGNAPSTAATMLYGREIGVPPITALQTMHVINGRVGMAAELMRARVLAAGHDIEVLESTSALCRMRGRRRGSDTWTEVQWSKGDAQQAGLGGDAWRKYPRAMLVARASAELCRLVFPDVTHGMAATEELDNATTPTSGQQAPTRATLVSRRRTKDTPPSGQAPPTAVAVPPAAGEHSRPLGVVAPLLPGEEESPAQGDAPPREGIGRVPDSRADENTPPVAVPPWGQPLPLDMDPADLEADPRAQAELSGDGPATQPQSRHIMVLLRRLNMGATREERLRIAEAIVQRPVTSYSELTMSDASHIITTLLLALDSDDPRAYLRWLVDEGQRTVAERAADSGVGDE